MGRLALEFFCSYVRLQVYVRSFLCEGVVPCLEFVEVLFHLQQLPHLQSFAIVLVCGARRDDSTSPCCNSVPSPIVVL